MRQEREPAEREPAGYLFPDLAAMPRPLRHLFRRTEQLSRARHTETRQVGCRWVSVAPVMPVTSVSGGEWAAEPRGITNFGAKDANHH